MGTVRHCYFFYFSGKGYYLEGKIELIAGNMIDKVRKFAPA